MQDMKKSKQKKQKREKENKGREHGKGSQSEYIDRE